MYLYPDKFLPWINEDNLTHFLTKAQPDSCIRLILTECKVITDREISLSVWHGLYDLFKEIKLEKRLVSHRKLIWACSSSPG